MNKKIIKIFFILLLVLGVVRCARIGTPSGGDPDKKPPVVLEMFPVNESKNFNYKKIRIHFDEYVTVKDFRKKLIISPPMNNFPEISPSYPSKNIYITILDTLKENTTYTLNFGNSIQDNNEGNALPFFKYVFSTGEKIDTFKVKGKIFDAINKKTDNFVSVGLYEVPSKGLDSLFHKQKPIYVTNTLDSLTSFEISNVKEGKYILAAIKDKDNNYLYEKEKDKIGFFDSIIRVPNEKRFYDVVLFKEKSDRRTIRPTQVAGRRLLMPYKGDRDSIKVRFEGKDFKYVITDVEGKDSLNIWLPKKLDTLTMLVKNAKIDTFKINLRKMKEDSLKVTAKYKDVYFDKGEVVLGGNIPFVELNEGKIKVFDKDSLEIPFKAKIDSTRMNVRIGVDVKGGMKYRGMVYPEAVKDFYGNVNDTIKVSFVGKKKEDFSKLKLNFVKKFNFPILVEFTKGDSGKVVYSKWIEKAVEWYNFEFLVPDSYQIRVVEDRNSNKKWDTGDVLKREQPEKVYIMPKKVELRANWEVEENF